MSKWPDKKVDRVYPADVPDDYWFNDSSGQAQDGITWAGFEAVVIGLCRRVELLERQLEETKRRQVNSEMSAAYSKGGHGY